MPFPIPVESPHFDSLTERERGERITLPWNKMLSLHGCNLDSLSAKQRSLQGQTWLWINSGLLEMDYAIRTKAASWKVKDLERILHT